MKKNLRLSLQNAFDQIEFICRHGDFYTGLEATEIADNAYLQACRHGCTVEMPKLVTDHDALRLAGQLLTWVKGKAATLTVQQAAERLGVSARTVYDLCETGDLKHQRIGKGRGTIRIRPADLDRLNSEPETYRLRHIG